MRIYTISSSNGKNFGVDKGVSVGYRKMKDGRYIPCVLVGHGDGWRDLIPVRLSRMTHQNWKRFLDMNLRGGRMHRDKVTVVICNSGHFLVFCKVPRSARPRPVSRI